MPSSRRRALIVLGLLMVSACNAETTGSTTIPPSPSTSPPPTVAPTEPPTSDTVPTTTTLSQPAQVTVFLSPFKGMGSGWEEQVFPYGEGMTHLGTSLGGDGLMLGPEYGSQLTDLSWWFLDAAKLRLAHFANDGSFIEALEIPASLLVNGQYFQYQMPQALDNGWLVAHGFRGQGSTALLLLADGAISGRNIDGSVSWANTDGVYLYGLDIEDGAPRRLDPESGVVDEVDWLVARDGSRYMVGVEQDRLVVELPDAGLTKTVSMRFANDPETPVRGGIEVETGDDGTLFILVYGAPTSDETLGVGGLITIATDGHVSEAEPIVDPFSSADPGSPAHLGVTPGSSTPWIMVIGEDGVHVHTFSG